MLDKALAYIHENSTQGYRVGIVGSRDYSDLQTVRRFVHKLPLEVTVVSGGARGVDRVAENNAKVRGIATLIHLANWERDGKSAGYIRNVDIVKSSNVLVAFWDGISRGTKHSIGTARLLGVPVFIIGVANEYLPTTTIT